MDEISTAPSFPSGTNINDVINALKGAGSALATTWPAQMGTGAYHGAKVFGQGLAGELNVKPTTPGMWSDEDEARQQLTNEETHKRINDVAGFLGGGGMPFAQKNAAGIFGGKLAKTANQDMRNTAELLEGTGAFRDDILNKTGWFRGADGQWRFEIPDNKIAFNRDLIKGDHLNLPNAGVNLDKFLHHPDLFAAYPHLRETGVYPLNGMWAREAKGGFVDDNLLLNSKLADQKTVLHELQHAVQDKEGFTRGSNPAEMAPPNFWEMKHQMEGPRTLNIESFLGSLGVKDPIEGYRAVWQNHLSGRTDPELNSALSLIQGSGKYNDVLDFLQRMKSVKEISGGAMDKYHRVAGEVEANNTVARIPLDMQARKTVPPWYTQSIPDRDQLVLPQESNVGQLLKALTNRNP